MGLHLLVTLALAQTDERVLADRPVSPAFLFAALLWHEVLAAWKEYEAGGEHTIPALHRAMDRVLEAAREKLAIPHRFSADMTEIWAMQPRFLQRVGRRPWRLRSTRGSVNGSPTAGLPAPEPVDPAHAASPAVATAHAICLT